MSCRSKGDIATDGIMCYMLIMFLCSEEASTKKLLRRGRKLFNNKPSEVSFSKKTCTVPKGLIILQCHVLWLAGQPLIYDSDVILTTSIIPTPKII